MINSRIALILIISLSGGYSKEQNVVSLGIYYESLCPDCINFILNQLRPAMRLLHRHIHLQLVPWGIAKSLNYGFDGFDCQHGPTECYANMVHDCTLNLMKARQDTARLNYVACEMETKSATLHSMECVERAGVSSERVEECVTTNEGRELQLRSEMLTKLVYHKWTPIIVINGEYNQAIQDSGQEDLISTLCTVLKSPHKCKEHYNQMALRALVEIDAEY